ncbi:MAG TPA: SprB repeat-containing protein, partial [Saprospiraceae bacterium]|nr:SprB repeat-containing protein [Saprospiraceae bacterium]
MKRALLLFVAVSACFQMYGQLPAAQTLPFTQDWTNTNLITADDDWSGVPGIIGFRGDNITGGTGVDPQTLLADDNPGVVDVIANQTNPNTNATGGVAEFQIANPVVAMQGSGTADAPYLLIGINTSCLSNITIAYNVRDIDGSTDNAVQQVALQYRVGSTGSFTNVPAAYIADATTGPSMATQVTAINVTLPANASNQPAVYLRIMTTNAVGNDEWVGIDDISISGTPIAATISGFGQFCISGNLDITVGITGGTSPYTVVFTEGFSNYTVTGYTSGATISQPVNFTSMFTLVSVTDAGGCTATSLSGTATAFVSQTLPSIEILSQTNPTCANNDGAIDINVTDGQPPYTYAWTTADGSGLNPTAEDQTGLGAGTYEVVATDDNGCASTPATSVTLTLPPGCNCDIDIADVTATAETCTGDNNGTITITATCTTCASIEYSIDGTNFQPDNFFTGLAPGAYNVKARDTADPDCMDIALATVDAGDATPPVFDPPLPQDITISCSDPVPSPATLTATDNTDTNPLVTFSESETPGACPQERTITRTWTATDDCGNSTQHVQVITVDDFTPPVFDGTLPEDITVSCEDPLPPVATLTATDDCDNDVQVVPSATLLDGNCPQELIFTFIWTATDDCGNTAVHQQIITVVDDTPPVFNTPLPQDITVSCSAPLPLAPSVTASDNCDPGQVPPVIFINEIHYDNVGTDVGEFVELAGTAGLDLSQYQIVLYNGNGGVTYDITPLSGLIDNESGGFGAISFGYALNGLQNGAPDGIALVKLPNTVVQFLSYEGTFVATNGPAAGMTSTDIGVAEEPAPPIGLSLQLTGAGQEYGDFTWVGPVAQTPGILNAGQSITPLPGTIQATMVETSMMGDCAGEMTVMRTWTATDACGNSATYVQTIQVQDNEGPSFVPPLPQNITISCSDPVPPPVTLLATDACDDGSGGPTAVWINEIHYDNAGTDVNEFIEVAGTAGVDLSAYSLFLYNGTGGGTYGSMTLSGIIPNQSNGFGTAAFTYPVNGLQNGSPDGVALVSGGMVIQFLSYEGVFVAVGGPANGMTSTDIGVQEDGTNAAGTSLRLSGTGDQYSDFSWNAPATATPGTVNTGQTFIAAPIGLVVTFSETNTKGTNPANCNYYNYTITRTWSVEDDCGNSNTHVQVITVQDVTPPTFTGVPANVTLSCNQSIPAAPTNVTATDNCSATSAVTFTEVSTQGANPANCNFYTYTITRTWSATDVCGNVGNGIQVITVQDISAPSVTCTSITVSLNIFGNITITGASVNANATDNCAATANLTVLANPVTFTCAQAGTTQPYVVQVSDPCGNIGVCTSQVTILPFPRCTPKILISDPCVCKNNATTLTNGQFGETLKIESLAGKTWTVVAVNGLWSANSPAPPTAPVAIPIGTQFIENPLNSGDYYLSGIHIDDLGYSITVQSESGQVLTIGNSCKYPNPAITSDLSGDFCLYSDPVPLTGTPGDNNIISQGFTINGVPATEFNPGAGVGQYFIEYTVNGGTPKAAGPNDPGCIQKVSAFVNVIATPTNLVCNDLLYVSLDADCTEEILPDQVLEGSYYCYDDYKVELDKTPPYGNGAWIPPFVDANDIGKTYAYRVTHLVSGTLCWGNIKIEDKLPPLIECSNITLNCAITTWTPEYLANVLGIITAYPNVSDCSAASTSYIDTWTNLECDETINGQSNISGYISRKWTA